MGDALDRLRAKVTDDENVGLAVSRVKAYVAKRGTKYVPVVGYKRQFDASPSPGSDAGNDSGTNSNVAGERKGPLASVKPGQHVTVRSKGTGHVSGTVREIRDDPGFGKRLVIENPADKSGPFAPRFTKISADEIADITINNDKGDPGTNSNVAGESKTGKATMESMIATELRSEAARKGKPTTTVGDVLGRPGRRVPVNPDLVGKHEPGKPGAPVKRPRMGVKTAKDAEGHDLVLDKGIWRHAPAAASGTEGPPPGGFKNRTERRKHFEGMSTEDLEKRREQALREADKTNLIVVERANNNIAEDIDQVLMDRSLRKATDEQLGTIANAPGAHRYARSRAREVLRDRGDKGDPGTNSNVSAESKGSPDDLLRRPDGSVYGRKTSSSESGLTEWQKNQRAIAKKTLDMPDAMVGVMGGPNKEESRKILDEERTPSGHRPLHRISDEIARDWKNPNFAAAPYLSAMRQLNDINDNYGADSAQTVISYFLSNSSQWKGETARRVKAELRAIQKKSRR